MEKYQERLLAELKELNEKIEKLKHFIDDSDEYIKLDVQRRELLVLQLNTMEQYAVILCFLCKAEGIDVTTILATC